MGDWTTIDIYINKKYVLRNAYLPNACCFQPQLLKCLTCNFNDLELRLFKVKVKGYGANRKPICGFLSDLHFVQNCICHGIRDI